MTRWGIAGTGGISVAFAAALRDVPDAKIVAVGSRWLDKAETFTRTCGPAAVHGSYEALMADPDVEIVYIATPAAHHYRHTLMALNAGKHVLVEKPFAVNATQAGVMAALAETMGLFLMEAMWPRFLPVYDHVRMLIADGQIGDVRMLQAAFGGRADYNPQHTAFRTDLAGGSLLHGGIYPVQWAHMICGPPDRVAASAWFAPTGVDTDVAVVLKDPSGRLSTLASSIRTTLDGQARIYGAGGMIVLPGSFTNPPWIEVHWPGKEPLHIDCLPDLDRLAYQAIAVQEALNAEWTEHPTMPLTESVAVMGTLDRVREAIGLRFPDEVEAI